MLRFAFVMGCLLLSAAVRAQMASLDAATPDVERPDTSVSVGPTVYLVADEMPAFPGGAAALVKFLATKLEYPAAALERQLSGKVYVHFTVDPEGRPHNPEVVKGLGSGLDEEALRLVRLMPWWTPGRIQGQPVWVRVIMPITFRAL